jgi:excinuclease UvrABC helicase subunit UvrB
MRVGEEVDQRELLRQLVELQYERNDMNLAAASSGCGAT